MPGARPIAALLVLSLLWACTTRQDSPRPAADPRITPLTLEQQRQIDGE